MRGRVIEHDVQFAAAVPVGDAFHEAQKVRAGVARLAASNHTATGDLERRVQTREPIATIVMGLPGGEAGSQRQQRLRATERLNLRLLVQAQHDGVRRRI
jgi:hypothetical protein